MVKFDLGLFLFVFITESVYSHKCVLPISDDNLQAKFSTLPYVLKLRIL